MIPKELLTKNLGISQHGGQCVLKTFKETKQVEEKRRSGRCQKKSTADIKYLIIHLLLKNKGDHTDDVDFQACMKED